MSCCGTGEIQTSHIRAKSLVLPSLKLRNTENVKIHGAYRFSAIDLFFSSDGDLLSAFPSIRRRSAREASKIIRDRLKTNRIIIKTLVDKKNDVGSLMKL